jgi:hypothetical protein
MADGGLDVVRRECAELTGRLENAALMASAGQGVQTLDGARQRFRRLSRTMGHLE